MTKPSQNGQNPYHRTSLAHRQLIGQLRASEKQGAAAIAAILFACADAAPCRRSACPACELASQRAAVALIEEFVRIPARDIRNRMTALTIVPASDCISPDALLAQNFEQVAAEVLTQGIDERLVRQRLEATGWARDGPWG